MIATAALSAVVLVVLVWVGVRLGVQPARRTTCPEPSARRWSAKHLGWSRT
jgi:hypothetical protein